MIYSENGLRVDVTFGWGWGSEGFVHPPFDDLYCWQLLQRKTASFPWVLPEGHVRSSFWYFLICLCPSCLPCSFIWGHRSHRRLLLSPLMASGNLEGAAPPFFFTSVMDISPFKTCWQYTTLKTFLLSDNPSPEMGARFCIYYYPTFQGVDIDLTWELSHGSQLQLRNQPARFPHRLLYMSLLLPWHAWL